MTDSIHFILIKVFHQSSSSLRTALFSYTCTSTITNVALSIETDFDTFHLLNHEIFIISQCVPTLESFVEELHCGPPHPTRHLSVPLRATAAIAHQHYRRRFKQVPSCHGGQTTYNSGSALQKQWLYLCLCVPLIHVTACNLFMQKFHFLIL